LREEATPGVMAGTGDICGTERPRGANTAIDSTAGAGPGPVARISSLGSDRARPARARLRSRLAGWPAVLVPGITLLLVDGFDLGRLSFWRDEAYTLAAAHRSLPQIFALLRHTNAVNGAYYVVIHVEIALLGTSEAALRLPSLLAMAVAAVVTAAIGRRLALMASMPGPTLTGLLAGLLFVATPLVTRFAHDARTYGIVTMFAALATYLLLRALAEDRWRWWAGYGLVITLTGLFHLVALLLVAAHGVTIWIVRARPQSASATGRPTLVASGLPRVRLSRWLAAVTAAVIVLIPLLLAGFRQRAQIGWLRRPGPQALGHLVIAFAGSKPLVPLVVLTALGGVLACLTSHPWIPLNAATVALPWLVLPPAILIAVSQVHPVYDLRYVAFSLPALALLSATGLAWLARVTALTPLGRARSAMAWLPSALIVVALVAMVMGPQQLARSQSSRPDNLRAVSAIVAAHERPGDGILYIPSNYRVVSMGYPGPFRRLRDLALAKSPVAAGNLLGTRVSTTVLARRTADMQRVWIVSGRRLGASGSSAKRYEQAEIALLRPFHVLMRWRVRHEMLSLFVRG
jgi:mannosyltransferase